MAPPETDLDHWASILEILFPNLEDTYQVLRLWPLLYLSRQVEKEELPPEEDYGVQLHVVDYNLECSFFLCSTQRANSGGDQR